MIWLTCRQFRVQAAVAVIFLAVAAVVLGISGSHLRDLYDTSGIAACNAHGPSTSSRSIATDCATVYATFASRESFLRNLLGPLLLAIPVITGIFWGAPLLARELENGTYRLAWTQSVTRARWLATKIVLIALAVTASALIRRTLPAMATTLVAFVGARLIVTYWIRPHLIGPAHTTTALQSATNIGFEGGPLGETFVAGNPSIPNTWVLSSRIVDAAGRAPTTQSLHRFLQTACPDIGAPPVDGGAPSVGGGHQPANQETFQACINQLSAKFHLAVTYQPASRYWPLQGYGQPSLSASPLS